MQYTQLSRRSAGGKIDWEKQYLTFIPMENTVFSWAQRAISGNLEYSLNGGQTWVIIANGESTPIITAGSKVMWRGDLKPSQNTSGVATNGGIGKFSATGNYHAYGNTMSLLFYDNYYGSRLYDSDYATAFAGLFFKETHILTAPLLPSPTLTDMCYHSMFAECTSLTTASELPATTLASNCYRQMFYLCRSLTTAPELPATTSVSRCYYLMFAGCHSLTTAPELPAITLTNGCYQQMFQNCIRLNYIKCLARNISATNCTYGWLSGVASTGTFAKAAEMEDWSTGASGIPEGWTVVDDNQ